VDRSPAEARNFSSSLSVQSSSETHPASYPMRTEGPFPGGKRGQGGDADYSHVVLRSRKSRSYTSSPFIATFPGYESTNLYVINCLMISI
jgi:hypothetical protein